MFKALSAIVRHTPMHLMVTQQGELLSVILIPKPTGDAAEKPGLRAPIHATGTPEDLDRDLPAKLQEYLDKVIEVRAKIDLPIEALEKTAKGEDEDEDGDTPTAATPAPKKGKRLVPKSHPAKPAPKAAAKPAPKAASKPAAARAGRVYTPTNAPKPSAACTPASIEEGKIMAVAKAAGATVESTPPKSTTDPRPAGAGSDPKRPTREQCLEDYRQACAAAGKPLNRAEFIAAGTTGRRYEKHWNNDWKAFTQEAGGGSGTATAAHTRAAPTTLNPQLGWPFPLKAPDPTPETAADAATDTTTSTEETAS